jgi:hypothetical protein
MKLFTDFDLGIPDDDWRRPSRSDLAAEEALDRADRERRRREQPWTPACVGDPWAPVVQDPWQAAS